MKMAYERPVMNAEVYMTNVYCSVCTSRPVLAETITTSDNATDWFSPKTGNKISASELSGWDLSHTFMEGDALDMVRPEGVWGAGQTQYFWKCSCPEHSDGSATGTYFLEYSTECAEKYSGQNVFVLYKDTNGNGVLNVNWGNGGYLPDNPGRQNDQGIGATIVNFDTMVVENS